MSLVRRVTAPVEAGAALFDSAVAGVRPSKLVVVAVVLLCVLRKLRRAWRLGAAGCLDELKRPLFRFLRAHFSRQLGIDKAINGAVSSFTKEFAHKQRGVPEVHERLPEQGEPKESVVELARRLAALNDDASQGKFSGCVYHDHSDHYTEFINEVMGLFQWTNPLHGGNFSGVRKMEAELISMTVGMFNGGPDACGAMTSGGTESILLAMKAYRDYARERGVTEPELVVPVTAHAAFDKAAHYFGLRIRHARMDPVTCKVDMKHMRSMVNSNTIALVGSAPQFPHGIIDPIPEIAALGRERGIPVHVDACLGGFLVAFMKKAGYELPHPVDFTVPGVTSISCDTHKYGFACKGSSVIMYSNPTLRRYQMCAAPNWPGGIYASPTIAGSRAGNIVAGTWAAMMYHGEAGYVRSTRKVISTARWIAEQCRAIPGLKVMGEPLVSVVALCSDEVDIYRVMGFLGERGWELNGLQYPSSIHLCVTLMHAQEDDQGRRPHAERFVEDCRAAAAHCLAVNEKPTGAAAIYGSSQSVPDRSIVGDVACSYFDAYYNVHVGKELTQSDDEHTPGPSTVGSPEVSAASASGSPSPPRAARAVSAAAAAH